MQKFLLFAGLFFLSMLTVTAQTTVLASLDNAFQIAEEKESIPLTSALTTLSREYEVYFSYDLAAVKEYEVAKHSARGKNVEEALTNVLVNTPLKYKKVGTKNYVVFKQKKTAKTRTKPASSTSKPLQKKKEKGKYLRQTKSIQSLSNVSRTTLETINIKKVTVNGQVFDETDQPMIGVTVFVKDQPGVGTTTDFDGNFSLTLPDLDQILVFSYVGYQSKELALQGTK